MNIIHAIKFLGWYFLRCEKVDQTKPLSWPGGFDGAGGGVTEQWVKDNFINSDASTYVLTNLDSLFLDSSARLAKITAEDKMPTTGSYTVFSLGWTYTDSENAPALIAVQLSTGKLYYYQGTEANCNSLSWNEIKFVSTNDLKNTATGQNSLAIGRSAATKTQQATAIGNVTNARADKAVGLGYQCNADGERGIAIGYNATVDGQDGIQLGYGTNREAHTFCVALDKGKNYKLLHSDGVIPFERLGSVADNGLRGDYCSQYGVIQATAGLPTIGTGNTVNLPGGLVLKLQGTASDPTIKRTTLASPQTVTLTKTTDSILAYVEGVEGIQQCDKICFSPSEPPNDESTCRLWNDGTQMYFRDINHGDTWMPCRAAVLSELHYTDGVLTWLDFTGWYHLMPTAN